MNFSRPQIFFLFVLFIGISNHVILLPHLLQVSKRDAWIAALIAYFILLIWTFFIRGISLKIQQQSLKSWLDQRVGKVISSLIICSLMIYILIIGAISFNDLISTIQIYFLPATSIWLITIPFITLCTIAGISKLNTIVYPAIVCTPIVLILGCFVAVATMKQKEYSYMFPILANNSGHLLEGILMILGANVDLLLLLVIQNNLKKPYTYLNLIALITILIILVLGPTLGAIAAFGPEVSSQMRFPAFEQWRLVQIGSHISHLDYLAIFQLIVGVFIRVSFCIFLMWRIWETPLIKVKSGTVSIFIVIALLLSLPQNTDIFIQSFIQKYFYPSAFIYGCLLTVTFFLISISKRGRTV
ncbi:endospore germination permease [Halobacillus litoralis]|uniref:endospore germination permease n=1 Tax=Halobacillus litoralis TaxID=45668 RepID=UPI001CFCDBB5|nr:endospore germination permease [Halobacillus litoralis]WLR47298.1 endospore germination permease [Halobacillus litoralis]